MTTPKPTTLVPIPTPLATRTTDELLADYADGLGRTAAGLARMAAVWNELHTRGQSDPALAAKLAELSRGQGRLIPLIATGRLAAESVVAFAGRNAVLNAIEGLPLDRQRELAAGGAVQVLTPETAEAKPVPLVALTTEAIRLVFADGVERTPDEQRAVLVTRRPKKAKAADPGYRYHPVVDRERRVVRIGKMEVPVESILAAFAEAASGVGVTPEELRAAKDRGDGVAIAQGLLTPEEDERLKAVCRAKRLDRGDAVRQAVVAMWML